MYIVQYKCRPLSSSIAISEAYENCAGCEAGRLEASCGSPCGWGYQAAITVPARWMEMTERNHRNSLERAH